jgi:ribosomal protein S18 acetylase RimI-like enzyme/glycosyltransferase involved in cell wall biosynthesis
MVKLKRALFQLLGKDPEAVVVSFCSGPEDLARKMVAEIRSLVQDREHFAVADFDIDGVTCVRPSELPERLRRKRIGLAPVLFTGEREYRQLRMLAFRMAPDKVLAYNRRLERHHLRFRTWIASLLFLRGVPLDRIWLRPKWLFPARRERSQWPGTHTVYDGRALTEGRPRVAILSSYFPFPLSHGGAVRIYNLVREAAKDFDVFLFAFAEQPTAPEGTPILDYVAKIVIFQNPRYREPRWASIQPPEVNEFSCEHVARTVEEFRTRYDVRLLQVEYTQMAKYGGDVLVEHDVTFDLYQQVHAAQGGLGSWWNLWRWLRFERRAINQFRRVVAMSEKDASLLAIPHVTVIPNGVDVHRFRPEREPAGNSLLFVGSFAHFPNVVAFRFFIEDVWPLLSSVTTDIRFTVIAGPNPHLYWNEPILDPRIELHGFISDVRPFYNAANLVVVPTRVSAGTNLKVLEAMAMERAVVSTTSGCAGLGLQHGLSIWIADTAADFASGVRRLLADDTLRRTLALNGRQHAQSHYDWSRLGVLQKRLWKELLADHKLIIRPGADRDLPEIERIQAESHGASRWEPDTYFRFDVHVAESSSTLVGFMVTRRLGVEEVEILNIAVAPEARRCGIATALIDTVDAIDVFLEVRESNTPARKLYEKLGFRVVGRRDEYYDDPVESALVMRKSRSAQ